MIDIQRKIFKFSRILSMAFAISIALNLSTLIEHWNGTKWSIVPSPNQTPQGNNINILLGIDSSGPGKLWAVGEWESLVQGNPGQRTLTLHTIQG